MPIKLIPLTNAIKRHVLTPSNLESSKIISDQEFNNNFEQGKFHPISSDASGKGSVSMQPTYYDRRDGSKGSYLIRREGKNE